MGSSMKKFRIQFGSLSLSLSLFLCHQEKTAEVRGEAVQMDDIEGFESA